VEPFATAVGLAAAGGLLLVATLLSPVSQRLGVPVLLFVLGVGMLAGSEGVGGIPFDDYLLTFRVGTIALVLILFDGGLGTAPSALRQVLAPSLVLATVGVLITAAGVAVVAMALGFPPALAMLVGAVVSSTDAAAVFAVLRGSGVRLRERTGAILEVESGLNDPVALLLTVVATEVVLGEGRVGPALVLYGLRDLAIGALFGMGIGRVGRRLLRMVPLPAPGLYPVLTFGIALVAYGVPTLVWGSGFLSTYVAGLVLGAGQLPYRPGYGACTTHSRGCRRSRCSCCSGCSSFRRASSRPRRPGSSSRRPSSSSRGRSPCSSASSRSTRHCASACSSRGSASAARCRSCSRRIRCCRGVAQGDVIFHIVFFVVLANGLVPGATVGWLARRFGWRGPSAPCRRRSSWCRSASTRRVRLVHDRPRVGRRGRGAERPAAARRLGADAPPPRRRDRRPARLDAVPARRPGLPLRPPRRPPFVDLLFGRSEEETA
jgi:cell volume regulation protein A